MGEKVIPEAMQQSPSGENRHDAVDYSQYSPLALAYIGDAVYDLIIRDRVVREGSRQVNKLHRETIHYVNAAAQSKLILELMPRLTQQETHIYKRGRNAVSHTVPKNQDVGDYRRATGFEALIGWLFLCGNYARIMELLSKESHVGRDGASGAMPSDGRPAAKESHCKSESGEAAGRMIQAMQTLCGDGGDAASLKTVDLHDATELAGIGAEDE